MVSLRAYQEELKDLIFFRDQERSRSRLWDGEVPDRLNVYRHNTRSNWTDTLDNDFPLTRRQFGDAEWDQLRKRYFIKHPPEHWELNQSIAPFVGFLKLQKGKACVQELADYEWNDLHVFIDRAVVAPGSGMTNPTASLRAYHHQIFFWAQAGAPPARPPAQKPEVLVFYRDRRNTCHIEEADPLLILLMEHFRKPGAVLEALDPLRRRLLPTNTVSLETVYAALQKKDLIL